MSKKITERTYGPHAYMKMELDGKIEEIDVFFRDDGEHYKTSADDSPERRKQIIDAFNRLY